MDQGKDKIEVPSEADIQDIKHMVVNFMKGNDKDNRIDDRRH